MRVELALTALVVRDYDEAIDYFTERLGFGLREDRDMGSGKRWVVVAPRGGGAGILLAKAVGEAQERAIGNQSGGRVMFFLHTGDFASDYQRMRARGVRFVEEPRHEAYGRVCVFEDLYGNKWDLIEPADKSANRV
jgi:catechol 2,3-dioxygenase-like lactoylglutathione lyase family enzyme